MTSQLEKFLRQRPVDERWQAFDTPLVHKIVAWSTMPQDETPICGVDRFHPVVWGNRTVTARAVTCPTCLSRMESKS